MPTKSVNEEVASLPALTQEQLGKALNGKVFTMTDLIKLREKAEEEEEEDKAAREKAEAAAKEGPKEKDAEQPAEEEVPIEHRVISWPVTKEHIGMGLGGAEIPASEFQAANPIFILLFGLVFSGLWSALGAVRLEPSTTVKFALGLVQLGLAFGAFWYGAQMADGRGMVAMYWLLLGYLLQTTGELCLSPVGLSMVTKLSPTGIVSTVMGAWFLATAFSNYLAGIIATFTGVLHEGEGEQVIPAPAETVNLYGDVFGTIAITAIASGLICFALAPLLTRWTHAEAESDDEAEATDET